MGLAARRAHRIISVSTFAREELLREFSVDPARVDVIPNGVGVRVASQPISERELRAALRARLRPVALTVATNLPHKNLERLFDSLALIGRAQRPVLILAGAGTDDTKLNASARAGGGRTRCAAARLL